MNQLTMFSLKLARRIYGTINRPGNSQENRSEEIQKHHINSGQKVNELIKSRILDEEPCMICRFGSSELMTIIRYLHIIQKPKFMFEKSLNYISGNSDQFWWNNHNRMVMQNFSGLFPATDEMLETFCRKMICDMQNIDILGSWLAEESEVASFMSDPIKVHLDDLEPYYHSDPWSEALEGKTVLVIHPFEQSVQKQYLKRTLLFDDARVLPKFELKTLEAIQSLGGQVLNRNVPNFDTWFDAFDWMCDSITDTNFDVAIIGAGAYGLPLAAYVKRLGKKAIHLGGATQILFGIKGKRWDERPFYQHLYNQHWVRPMASEVPSNAPSVEGACYW